MISLRLLLLPLAAAALIGATPAMLAAQCDTLPPRRDIDFDSIAVFQFQSGGASCWGWEAPDGRHYAIMGGQRSIGFVDVQTMTVVDTVPTQFCQWRELKTYRNYCYAVSECTGDKQGMMIIDMRYLPDSVRYVGSYVFGSNVRSHCISIDTARGYCYLVRQNYSGFRIVSLANPEAPVEVGGVTTGDLHDMTAFNDTVYAAEAYNSSFSIWNCANKAAPVMLARVTIPGGGYVHNVWPSPDRRYLASTEEVPVGRTMKVWNMEDLGNISLVDQYIGPGRIPHNAHIEGDYLFISHYTSGVSVLDFNYPECLVVKSVFDTYLANDNADYEGCWGVYPHTNGSGRVYASNIDGRLFIFQFTVHPYAASAAFAAAPRVGEVPLDAAFTSAGMDLDAWAWDFGDGGQATVANPTHTYTTPGIYDVSLAVAGPGGVDTALEPAYVLALAETLHVADTGFDRNTSVVWDVNLHNQVPIDELRLPITLSGVPELATFDSISFVGCRTSYFETRQILDDSRPTGQIVVLLRTDAGGGAPDLAPGNGPIARLHLTIPNDATPGDTVRFAVGQIGFHPYFAVANATNFVPKVNGGAAVIGPPCDCACHADPICDGNPNIQDVVSIVAVAFRGNSDTLDPACVHNGRGDVNCSGSTDVIDVVLMVGAAFRGDDPNTAFCDPCGP
ncbi:MAG TPA: choice-of-anchor B family protein [bacterium]|nr:choice-of-anchor B family protein [bacterium]